jgi:hypothetical protein
MLVNNYNRLWVTNPGPSRLLGDFCEYAEAPLESRAAASRVGKPGRPTAAHCRPSVRTGYAQTVVTLQRHLATPPCNAILQRHPATRSHPLSLSCCAPAAPGRVDKPISILMAIPTACSMQPKNGNVRFSKERHVRFSKERQRSIQQKNGTFDSASRAEEPRHATPLAQ